MGWVKAIGFLTLVCGTVLLVGYPLYLWLDEVGTIITQLVGIIAGVWSAAYCIDKGWIN
mgnify:CR=1 FL=1